MKASLQPGITHTFTFRVPRSKTVVALYPEAPEFEAMPAVFATGFLVGFVEWTCIQAVNPHLDWPAEMTLGTHIDLSHTAPTPPGMDVTARVALTHVEGRKLSFDVEVRDDAEVIGTGKHAIRDRGRQVQREGRAQGGTGARPPARSRSAVKQRRQADTGAGSDAGKSNSTRAPFGSWQKSCHSPVLGCRRSV